MTDYRIEKDSLGEVKVPKKKYWGAQTQRSLENFKIGSDKIPLILIQSFAMQKKAALISNLALGNIDSKIGEEMMKVCDEIINGNLNDHFPLSVWQTGSGTQTNMNLNEVIARDASVILLTDQEGLDNIGHLKNKIKTFILDETDIISAPFVYTLPNQLIAYHIALLKGTDVDQPRNLAKSVTVE